MRTGGAVNGVRQGLASGRFVFSIEQTLPNASEPVDDALRPILALARAIRDDPQIDAIALTDRSRSDHDHDPIAAGARVADVSGKTPIVHWAGKDRSLRQLDADLDRADALGLDTFLMVTGDKLRHPPADRPVRYLDSVNALSEARRRSAGLLLAGAVCPFKYRQEALLGQYFKAAKKVRAGADFLMTQIGWDRRKFAEAASFVTHRGDRAPLVAELLYLTASRARRIRTYGLPGVTVTAPLVRRLEEDAAAPDGGRAAAYRRLALQIVMVRDLGYAGVQVSGLGRYDSVARLREEVDRITDVYPTAEARVDAWDDMLRLADGTVAAAAPPDGFYLDASGGTSTQSAAASTVEWTRFRAFDAIDRAVFQHGSLGARVVGPVLRRLDPHGAAGHALLSVERAIKAPLLGCQTCGFCRLPDTAYVCPETCPKGLANGPCGGTTDNRCEFGDRECIHARIYRIAERAGTLPDLEAVLIPAVPEESWDTCSWIAEFSGVGPQAIRLGGR